VRLARAEAWLAGMELAEPYSIAYDRVEKAENVFLRLETTTGLCGFGCAAPDPKVTGESPAAVMSALSDIVVPCIRGTDPLRPLKVMERFRMDLAALPSARAALSMALFDLMGKHAGLPLWKLLGGFRSSFRTSVTVGIMGVAQSVSASQAYVRRGFKALKIKGGSDLDSDIERVLRIREAIGPRIELRFDANQGYSVKEALEFVAGTQLARDTFDCISIVALVPASHAATAASVHSTTDFPAACASSKALTAGSRASRSVLSPMLAFPRSIKPCIAALPIAATSSAPTLSLPFTAMPSKMLKSTFW